ncbi:polyprenyl synthetase family protein [Paenibacillus cellulosilyticus]|uniref:polyprenyl synthetase family protein n=1 Tax=Paenibacillus cellulosilyticus TaxID=375489 RepID=UPI000D712BA9|nr:farnesyl diphosphate synthase [Paenibacillus cellulosilyticus]QKS45328.1 polyprenyl synthetase family protein [Paenibacillus cellulosilyticus]
MRSEGNRALSEALTTQQYISQTAAEVEAALKSVLPANWDVPAQLRESMGYSVDAGGKRLRPVLVLAAAEAIQRNPAAAKAAMPVACAIEMIHTYSLIHDDLPAMDDDDYRRGKLTNHKVFGEAMAILAGDALLTHAFYSIVQSARVNGVPAEIALQIVEELSVLAGASGMVGGQAADMLGEQGVTSIEQLKYIHQHKTSDLIVFSLRAGAWIGGATAEQLERVTEFGTALGLAFQIQDDILDLIGDEAKLGKKTNSDVEQHKVTYPFLIGLEESQMEVERLTDVAKQALNQAELEAPARLFGIADYLMKRDH